MSTIFHLLAAIAGFSFLTSLQTEAFAQGYPTKPVTFIVPFPPGGGTDISARTLAAKLGEKWKQSVIVENKSGAAGILGAHAASRARADGYTLLVVNGRIPSINPAPYPRLP